MLPFKKYYELAKPGMVYGNIIPFMGGFLLGARGHINIASFFGSLFGLAFVIASACVFNNYIDRGMDRKMERTKNRALALGTISGRDALTYGIILGVAGYSLLVLYTNWLAVFAAAIGFFFYVAAYSITKRRTVHGTLVGAVAGAMPPVVGYAASTGRFDMAALLMFLLMVFWQMAHFYSIAVYRLDDYVAAGIPVLPVEEGVESTKAQILIYVVGFVIVAALLSGFGFAGRLYLTIAVLAGVLWVGLATHGFFAEDDAAWARKMFVFSLAAIFAIFIGIVLDGVI